MYTRFVITTHTFRIVDRFESYGMLGESREIPATLAVVSRLNHSPFKVTNPAGEPFLNTMKNTAAKIADVMKVTVAPPDEVLNAADLESLNRLIYLNACINEYEDDPDEEVTEEREELRNTLVARFVPVVQMLCHAGLLTCNMKVNPDTLNQSPLTDFSELLSFPYRAEDQGIISLQAHWNGVGRHSVSGAARSKVRFAKLQAERDAVRRQHQANAAIQMPTTSKDVN